MKIESFCFERGLNHLWDFLYFRCYEANAARLATVLINFCQILIIGYAWEITLSDIGACEAFLQLSSVKYIDQSST